MTQKAIVTDLNKCVGCLSCSVACKAFNNVQVGNYWTRVLRVGPTPREEGGQWPDVYTYFIPVSCQHCANPACVTVCPTGASQKMEDGTVQIDKDTCIGCQSCVPACPYGIRYLNEETSVVEKCNLCKEKTDNGELPQCVAQCAGRARWYGDIEQGIESLQGPGCDLTDKSYEAQHNMRYTMADMIGEGGDKPVKPFTEDEVYKLPDAGNAPSYAFILRGEKWQDGSYELNTVW